MKSQQNIAIVGAGLAGSLLALYLAKYGLKVSIFEKRKDPRKNTADSGRSINLALSHRGIRPLKELDIAQEILSKAIPMKSRLIHDQEGNLKEIPYGKNDSEYINSISRSGLNIALLDFAEQYENIQLFFEHAILDVNFETNELYIENHESEENLTRQFEVIFATDGAGSAVRNAMVKKGRCNEKIDFIEHAYKELEIPASQNGDFQLKDKVLHIWPRKDFMLIALPNLDASFTCTLFLPKEGDISFEQLKDASSVQSFFRNYFPDVLDKMPQLAHDFHHNPAGLLGTVKCTPWHVSNRVLLLGDAAHAIVPFYGQGMNASFEDCYELNQSIQEHGFDWDKVFEHYFEKRKKNTDAIADLALENFYEMRDQVADPVFQKMRKLEYQLENQFEDYHSKYALVTFRPEIPYAEARERGNKQNQLLKEICKKTGDLSQLDIQEIYQKLKEI